MKRTTMFKIALMVSIGVLSFSFPAFARTHMHHHHSYSDQNDQPSWQSDNDDDYTSMVSERSRQKVRTGGRRLFIYNPETLTWKVYDRDGSFVRSGRGSGGRSYCPDIGRRCRTPVGTFSVIAKEGPDFKSSRYPVPRGGAPMPYAMFFTTNFAIHGSYELPGYNASHGCIRVTPTDARWLSQNFLDYGSRVVVQPY